MAQKVAEIFQLPLGATEAPATPEGWPPNHRLSIPSGEPVEYSLFPDEEPVQEILNAMKGSAAEKAVSIQNLLDDRLRLTTPVMLELEREGEFYIAKCDELEEYGYGYDPIEAVDDFRQTAAELYWTLKEEQSRLAPGMTQLWQKIQLFIEEV